MLIGVGRALADGLDCSYICDVAIHPEYQGIGLGRKIIEQLMHLSKDHKKIILLGVKLNIIITNIKWIMLIAGLLTCSMIFAVFTPHAVLINMFGETLAEPLANVVVRSWGFLIFLIGTLLIYGAFKPVYRNLALVIASISKIVFIFLILNFGTQYIDKSLSTIILDSIIVIIFLAYLFKILPVTWKLTREI